MSVRFTDWLFGAIYTKLGEISSSLSELRNAVNNLTTEVRKVTKELQALSDQVAQNTTVEASAITLIQGIADQLAAMKDDPAAVAALADQLKASASALGVAVTANTPVAVPPVV
jgi:archaellum component FlaC